MGERKVYYKKTKIRGACEAANQYVLCHRWAMIGGYDHPCRGGRGRRRGKFRWGVNKVSIIDGVSTLGEA